MITGALYGIIALRAHAEIVVIPRFTSCVDLTCVMLKIVDLIKLLGVTIAPIFLIYSGFLFVSAQGDPKKLETAKSTLWWTIAGTALLVGGSALAGVVIDFAQKL